MDASELTALVADADVVVVQGDLLGRMDPGSAVVVVDLYDPFHLEALEQTRHLPPDVRHRASWTARHVIDVQVRRGDLFLCASSRQRDFWLGHLAAAGRINELTYAASPGLESLITIVPFGVEDRRAAPLGPGAARRRPRNRRRRPRADVGWRHLQLVRPAHAAAGAGPRAPPGAERPRCSSLGTRHPNPGVGETRDGDEGPSALRSPAPDRDPRDLQRLGRLRRARRLPARSGHRRQHPLRPCRDRVLVPHARPGLPVGVTARDHEPR